MMKLERWVEQEFAHADSGARAGYDGVRKKKGSKVHVAVDTLGHLLALLVTSANEQERAQVGERAARVQDITGEHVELAFVDQGCTGDAAAEAAEEQSMRPEVIKLSKAKKGFGLLPRRWVSSAALPGRGASAAWRAITSGCLEP